MDLCSKLLSPSFWRMAHKRSGSRSVGMLLCAIIFALLRRALKKMRSRSMYFFAGQWLQVSSPLDGSLLKFQQAWSVRSNSGSSSIRWYGFCPCCKKPIETSFCDKPTTQTVARNTLGKFAYVINLWGSSAEYVLGALVLGFSLRRTGTRNALVCLHATDVPEPFVELLSRVWDCRRVEHVDVDVALPCWGDHDPRFEKVFTKLRGLELVEFEKILVMDIDMLVLSNIDEIFKLKAPAAMKRGIYHHNRNGDFLDGRKFFVGSVPGSEYSWGQGTGINAGVMLWQPNKDVCNNMLRELADPRHPSHCVGNGPEQDYLSRYWADEPWSHISVEYNFQLHHMFNALHPNTVNNVEWTRLVENPSLIRVAHYSGVSAAKPWQRILDLSHSHLWPDRDTDAEYIMKVSEQYRGISLWINRDEATWSSASRDPYLAKYYRGDDGMLYYRPSEGYPNERTFPLHIPESMTQGAMNVLTLLSSSWFDTYEALNRHLDLDLKAELISGLPKRSDGACISDVHSTEAVGSTCIPEGTMPALSRGSWSPRTFQPRVQWRNAGGWIHEQTADHALAGGVHTPGKVHKASVVCGSGASTPCDNVSFVRFTVRGVSEPHFCSDVEGVNGVFVKLGSQPSRPIPFHDGDVTPLRIWVDNAAPDDILLFAVVDVDADVVDEVLAAFAPLGVPPGPIPHGTRVLAGAGMVGRKFESAHASCDVAYASILVPCECGGQCTAPIADVVALGGEAPCDKLVQELPAQVLPEGKQV